MSGVLFRAEIWAVTRRGSHLVEMLDVGLEQVESSFLPPQVSGSHCERPQKAAANQISDEDLSHLPQLVNLTFVSQEALEDVQQTRSMSPLSSVCRTAATAPAWRSSVSSTFRPPASCR